MPPKVSVGKVQGFGRAPTVLESECCAIGCALRDAESAERVTTELQLEDFYSSKTASAFKAIKGLLDDSLTVNPVSVSERSGLPRTDVEELLGAAHGIGPAELKTILSEVQRVGALRVIYTACSNASSQIGKDSKLEEVVEALEKGLYRSDRSGADEAKDGSVVLSQVVDDFLRRHRDGGGPEISTGLRDLDRTIIGLRPGKMGVVAARPSMGKTALAGSIRRSVLAQGYGVIEFALEMSAEELLERELSFQASLNLQKVLSAKGITEDELVRVGSAARSINSGLWFIDDRTYGIAGMRRKARIISGRMARAGIKVGMVVIDYLQLAGDNGEDRQQSIAAVSRGAKFMAKELGCTVLALSQLNRQCEFREDRRPMMSDLRESGSIEQDADWVAFVYREHMYDESFPAEESELIFRKQRSGPTGTIHLRYNPKTVTFHDKDLPVPPQNVLPVEGVQ